MTDGPDDTAHRADWDPQSYARNARFVSDLGMPVVELLAPRRGERILDLGCGDGVLSSTLVELGCDVVGVDASEAMVRAARALGVEARVADGCALPFSGEFDAVFSNAALHWMLEPDRVIDGVWRALRPGGRFVGEFGGHGNVAAIAGALESVLAARGVTPPTVWYYPRPDEYQHLLEARGFTVHSSRLFARPTPLPGGLHGWLNTLATVHLGAVPEPERPSVVDEVVERLRPVLCDEAGNWTADYVRLRFSATKPA